MPDSWERHLNRWAGAALIDAETAQRIRAFEGQQAPSQGLRWPTVIALALGALLLGSGVLLFVSAHWDELAAPGRMALVVLLVVIFHAGGAFTAERFPALSIALHTVGTASLGAGIALTGQIFHLDTHWPAGILLWAAGAAIGWMALGHWTQAALFAVLAPYWLAGEWLVAMENIGVRYAAPVSAGMFLLSITYLTARAAGDDSDVRRALTWIGSIALIPASIFFAADRWQVEAYPVLGWSGAIAIPLIAAYALRGKGVCMNGIAAAWMVAAYFIKGGGSGDKLVLFAWYALGSLGLIGWGMRERRTALINFGVAGFALTVGGFYFSNVMDKLGRSTSLILLGILFLAGGWGLEQARRKLIGSIKREAA